MSEQLALEAGISDPRDVTVLSHFGAAAVDLTRRYDNTQGGLRYPYAKPVGLWLSDESEYGWTAWNRDEQFVAAWEQPRTDFRILPSANVLHLATLEEVLALQPEYGTQSLYPGGTSGIDWTRLAREYDGILVTPYQWQARLDNRASWYYGWDCASACIWNLTALERI